MEIEDIRKWYLDIRGELGNSIGKMLLRCDG